LRLQSPQREFSDDVIHMLVAGLLVRLLAFKIYVMHE